MIVIDASAAASWVLPHEDGIDLNRLIEASNDFFAPFLFWAEIRNVILVSERRGLILPEAASRAMSAIERLDVTFDITPSSHDVYNFSKQYGLSIYDSLYIELAHRKHAHLCTLDRKMRAAAEHEGIILIN
ncbi:MAG: type II toxin-antitoxin system VapC family toxin [Beijerinckiaceae bacterium]|nr:type II toxin-antitoxin system VapC family toxin [Beijerinckiaceae bacterium]